MQKVLMNYRKKINLRYRIYLMQCLVSVWCWVGYGSKTIQLMLLFEDFSLMIIYILHKPES